MKKRVLTILITAALVCSMCYAVSAEYGSSDDPLVSLSYINDTLLPAIYAEVDKRIAAGGAGSSTTTADTSYTPLQIENGKQIEAQSGSIEVLLRRGSFTAVDPLGDHLINMTDGGEAGDGETLKLQNLYVIARADGRAIKAAGDACWIMVRGDYKIS